MEHSINTFKHLIQSPLFLKQGWDGLFSASNPLNLEIGCGHGRFLKHMAEHYPQQHFIGIELISKLVNKLARQLEREQMNNALVIKADAMLALQELFYNGQLSQIFINFPDPWFKKRHRNRRVMREDTLTLYAQKLKTGGYLNFVTDNLPYAQDVEELLNDHPDFEKLEQPAHYGVITKYENKWLQQNREIYRLSYQCMVQHPIRSWSEFPSSQSLLSEIKLTPHFLANFEHFTPIIHRQDDVIIKVIECFVNPLKDKGLFKCIISQPGRLAHSIFVEVSEQGALIPQTVFLPWLNSRSQVLAVLKESLDSVLTPTL